jgi:hypothetical protein
MAVSLANEPANSRPDHKFTVSVPKADSYFPVMRYKCGNDLRPVPIVSVGFLEYSSDSCGRYLTFVICYILLTASSNQSKIRGWPLESGSTDQLKPTQ